MASDEPLQRSGLRRASLRRECCVSSYLPAARTRSGCARSPNGRCCGPASYHPGRCASCRIRPGTGSTWLGPGPRRSSGLRNCWRTPASSCRWSPATAYLRGLRPGVQSPPRRAPHPRRSSGGGRHGPVPRSAGSTPTSPPWGRIAQIGTHLAPPPLPARRRAGGPGGGAGAAAVIIAEIGVDMTRFPTPGHICSWAKFEPGVKTSAGKNKGNGSTGHGNRDLGVRAARRELIAFAVRMR